MRSKQYRANMRFLLLLLLSVLPAVAAGKVIVIFGDSITEGGALPAPERKEVWVKVVERESGGKLSLINEGKGGRPTASVPEFEATLKKHPKPDALVIFLGTNDSRDITPGCVPKAVSNIQKMIELGRKAWGAQLPLLLVGPPNLNKNALVATKGIGHERETKLKELGEGYAKLAKETRCEYVSLFGAVPEKAMSKDGVHPDVEGNASIARALGEKLRSLVK